MIKLRLSDPLDKVYDFIDNRLVLMLAENKLRQVTPFHDLQLLIKKEYRVKYIDKTILYTERDVNKASLIIVTNEKKASKVKNEFFGMALRARNDNTLDIYIDTLKEAFNKGILNTDIKRRVFWKAIFVTLALLGGIAITGGCLLILILLAIIFLYPIQYLFSKKKFDKTQDKMSKLATLFEKEFNVTSRSDTGDWINFWGRVKSTLEEGVEEFSPFRT